MGESTYPIRRAVNSGQFEEAARLWNEYCAGIQQEICLGTCTAPRMTEARELLEWVRCEVLCAKSHALDSLNANRVAGKYSDPDGEQSAVVLANL